MHSYKLAGLLFGLILMLGPSATYTIHAQAGEPKGRLSERSDANAAETRDSKPLSGPATDEPAPSIEELEAAIAAGGPSTAVLLNNLGADYATLGRIDEAISAFERAVEADPDLAKAHLNLSVVYNQAGRTADAIASARIAVELDPTRIKSRGQLCGLYMTAKKHGEAVRCFKAAMPLVANDHEFRATYAAALLRDNQIDEAINQLRQVISRAPRLAGAHNVLGVALFRSKKAKEAEASLKQAVELDPSVPEFRFNLGMTQIARENRAGALSQYNFLKRSDPALAAKIYKAIFSKRVVAAPRQ